MMRLTRAADYAIRVMMILAELPPDKVYSKTELARSQLVPGSFLSKILQQLVAAELIVSHRGVRGGFALNRKPQEITILDVMVAVEGPIEVNQCVIPEKKNCERIENCPAATVWIKVQLEMERVLRGFTLYDLRRLHQGKPVEACH